MSVPNLERKLFLFRKILNNPLSLNIKNTFDLVEKLTPLLYYIASVLEKIQNECENYDPSNCINFSVYVYPHCREYQDIFSVINKYIDSFSFDDLANVNIVQKIKLRILEKLESNYFNLLINLQTYFNRC